MIDLVSDLNQEKKKEDEEEEEETGELIACRADKNSGDYFWIGKTIVDNNDNNNNKKKAKNVLVRWFEKVKSKKCK